MCSGFTYFTQTTTPNFITGATPTAFAGCLSLFPSSSVTAVPARDGNTDLTSITIEGPLTMWAQPITVIYREEDVSLFTLPTNMTTSATAGPTMSSIGRIATSTSTSMSTPAPAPQPSKPLPGSVIGGIGIAAGIGAFILLTCIFILARRRYRAQNQTRARQRDAEDLNSAATDETGLNIIWPKHEKLPPPVEAPAYSHARSPVELYSSPKLQRYELGP
jgi:hypothetical protein